MKAINKEYYAHVRVDDNGNVIYQTVKEHLDGTAELCGKFASAFGAEKEGKLAGSLHDIGKYTEAFQHRLLNNGPKVDHATAGAIACAKNNRIFIAECVAGHHGGLQDFGNQRVDNAGDPTFCGRIKKGISEKYLEKCDVNLSDIADMNSMSGNELPYEDFLKISFWTKMLYSCLVDADYLDTESFMNCGSERGGYDDMPVLAELYKKYIQPWQNPANELNKKRCEILNSCIESGDNARGIYTLTVPTGGGKTVASLGFALQHAIKHGMKRIIYVIPYTSIIEQNADVFRKILGDKNVLEHHSGFQFDLSENASVEEHRKAYATENWDMPVIVTTSVQLFDSIYANKSSKCRKLHNLANSVIIFDEAQMIPLNNLKPCVAAITSLADQFNSTIVLCTATQPVLGDLIKQFAPGISIKEICPNSLEMFNSFKRVTYKRVNKLDDDQIAYELSENRQVLCVVNSRKAAQNIYSKLDNSGSYHLSTLMVPEHRKKILKKIRGLLSSGGVCRVVSTSLIEAGVDVDFPKVYRELAGLDSIVQAAGRCNREGKRTAAESIVTIFERTELPPILFRTAIGAAKEALKGDKDPGSPETIEAYFNGLRNLNGDEIDEKGIVKLMQEGISGCYLPYKTVAERFNLIDENTFTVYVPYDETAKNLIDQLKSGEAYKGIYRKLGRYSVSVYDKHFKALYDAGAILTSAEIETLDTGSAILENMSLYTEETGLNLEPTTGNAEFV